MIGMLYYIQILCIVANFFIYRYSLSSPRYRDIVGEPTIINHDATFSYTNEPEGVEPQHGWCVMIPHLDPGTANYGSVDPLILRLMFLCWVRTLILVDTAIDIAALEEHAVGTQPFAQQLLQEWQNREPAALTPAINQARTAVNDLRSNGQAGTMRHRTGLFTLLLTTHALRSI